MGIETDADVNSGEQTWTRRTICARHTVSVPSTCTEGKHDTLLSYLLETGQASDKHL